MSETIKKCFEYTFKCDICGGLERLYTGFTVAPGIVVHNILTARNACHFHQSKGRSLCDICFKATRKGIREKRKK